MGVIAKWLVAQWQYLAFAILLLLLYTLQPMALAYERDAIDAGQWWRLLTGQYLHLSLGHLTGNILGLGVAWLLFADNWRGWRFAWLAPLCVAGSSIGMWLFHPAIAYYVGFSGALYGLIAYGALRDWRNNILFGRGITIGLCLKVGYEYFYQPVEFLAWNDLSVLAVEAHFFGAITGFAVALLSRPAKIAPSA